jgi:hypothetical protein
VVADRPPSQALGALNELVEADVIRPSEMSRCFRFRHPIVRTVVYEGMPSGWRLGAHARAAAGLAADQAQAVAYAHHVERSARAGDEDAIRCSPAPRARPRLTRRRPPAAGCVQLGGC